jgi:hypothetical protein
MFDVYAERALLPKAANHLPQQEGGFGIAKGWKTGEIRP